MDELTQDGRGQRQCFQLWSSRGISTLNGLRWWPSSAWFLWAEDTRALITTVWHIFHYEWRSNNLCHICQTKLSLFGGLFYLLLRLKSVWLLYSLSCGFQVLLVKTFMFSLAIIILRRSESGTDRSQINLKVHQRNRGMTACSLSIGPNTHNFPIRIFRFLK